MGTYATPPRHVSPGGEVDALSGEDLRLVAAAVLFIGSKVEEHSVRINDLLNVVYVLCQLIAAAATTTGVSTSGVTTAAAPFDTKGENLLSPTSALSSLRLSPGQLTRAFPEVEILLRRLKSGALHTAASGTPSGSEACPLIVRLASGMDKITESNNQHMTLAVDQRATATRGNLSTEISFLTVDSYYSTKAKLIEFEQRILRAINFQVALEDPHRYLLNLAYQRRMGEGLVKLAVCILNDALIYTVAPQRASCLVLGTAALVLAEEIADDDREAAPDDAVGLLEKHAWWKRAGVSAEDLAPVVAIIMVMMRDFQTHG